MFEQLCPAFVTLLRQQGRFPEQSTYRAIRPPRGSPSPKTGYCTGRAIARAVCGPPIPAIRPSPSQRPRRPSRPPSQRRRCWQAGAPAPPRPPGTGCLCQGPACQPQCARASTRDREARLIHYAGAPPRRPGTTVFGYRSVAERALDDRFACAWTLRSGLYPANADERTLFDAQGGRAGAGVPHPAHQRMAGWRRGGLRRVPRRLWQLGARRLVAIRADPTDADPTACLRRGYDGHGRPLCPHGYPLRANGYDYQRRRTKYCCAQVCRRMPPPPQLPPQPVDTCPYRAPTHPSGFVVNVGRTLPDGSLRLAREIPYGSPRWQARYGRRNLAESRNAQIEGLGLKRLPNYGLARNAKELQLTDWLLNLRTLGRLVRQATGGPSG